MNKKLILKKIYGPEDAREFLKNCIQEFGGGFHPDTSADEYVNMKDNKPTFTKVEQKQFDENIEQLFTYIKDPYELGLRMCKMQARLEAAKSMRK